MDAVAVDALARLQLTALRLGWPVRPACVQRAAQLVTMGLTDVLPS